MIRLRFAPSPTGNLHIGSARTALFNYLYAKFLKGKFILRIEDTDILRSKKEYEEDIISGLKWLGINWDEGPGVDSVQSYYQLDRWKQGIYNQYCQQLIEEGKAYYCFCEQEEKDKDPLQLSYKYSGKCRTLSNEQIKENIAKKIPYAIRFKVCEEVVVFRDLVRGDISFDMALNGDLVIMRSDGMPTYNFAVVVDDMDMQITHVIRGEDHISNTPKQIQIFNALGKTPPAYGHISMILGPDKAKLSKRHGAKSITEFKNEGYLPEALFNFLALLGWSHPEDKEVIFQEDLMTVYDMARVSKSNSVFNIEKLNWLNGQYLRSYTAEHIYNISSEFLDGFNKSLYNKDQLIYILDVIKENLNLLSDIPTQLAVFFTTQVIYEKEHVQLEMIPMIEKFEQGLRDLEFTSEVISEYTNNFVKENNIKKGQIFHNVRYAVSAQQKGPSLFKMLQVFGKEKVCQRIGNYIAYVKTCSGS